MQPGPTKPGLRRTVDGWRRDFRQALANTGHTHDSVAASLEIPREHVSNMLSATGTRRLTTDHLEALSNNPATRDLWVEFLRLQAARAGTWPLDCKPLEQQLQELIEQAQRACEALGKVG